MALTEIQRSALAAIARNRSPSSHCAGGTVLNVTDIRLSDDIDLFHDAFDAVAQSFQTDRTSLQEAGFQVVETDRSTPHRGHAEARVLRNGDEVLLQWVHDSAVRFMPAIEDPDFGWRLHDHDLAVNKLLALAGRREIRDYYDIVRLIERGVSLAALAWAAPGKDPGFTPELILDEISRNSIHPRSAWQALHVRGSVDPVRMKQTFLTALREARDLLQQLPPKTVGHLLIDASGEIASIDTAMIAGELNGIIAHPPTTGGAWPQIPNLDYEDPDDGPLPS